MQNRVVLCSRCRRRAGAAKPWIVQEIAPVVRNVMQDYVRFAFGVSCWNVHAQRSNVPTVIVHH